MKSCDKLKAEMEDIPQKMTEPKDSGHTNYLIMIKLFCKEFGFRSKMLEDLLAKGWQKR